VLKAFVYFINVLALPIEKEFKNPHRHKSQWGKIPLPFFLKLNHRVSNSDIRLERWILMIYKDKERSFAQDKSNLLLKILR